MKTNQKKLVREQLDQTLRRFQTLRDASVPSKGWIRAIRNALGMTGEQLAERLHVNKQRISRLERDEKLGKVTLNTLKSTAEALHCDFVYGFVPHDSLEQIVRKQAEQAARKYMTRSNQMMRLEKQELSPSEKQKALQDLIDEMVRTMPRPLWEEM